MTDSNEDHESATVVPPVHLTVRCLSCGYQRTTLAMHENAITRAATCERCARPTERIAADHVTGLGCACCS